MISYYYSILDKKAEFFGPLFKARNDGEAVRIFTEILNDENSLPFKYPEDYFLYCICKFDDNTGYVDNSADYPRPVIGGKALVISYPPDGDEKLSTSARLERQKESLRAVNPVDNLTEVQIHV